jgi:predicted nucleic acid-binding protein
MKSLRQAGTPLPTNDVWIAASALQHGYQIASFDMHFRAISGLQTGTKISDFEE